MKNIKLVILGVLAALACSCQTVSPDNQLIPTDPSEVQLRRNVLLVEFTGLRCVNCPKAAEEAHNLLGIFPENLVVVAMHPASNSFTKPASGYDFTCPEADVYYKAVGGTATTDFPTGNINFAKDRKDNYLSYFTDWAGWIIHDGIAEAEVSVALSTLRATDSRDVTVDITLNNIAKGVRPVRVLLWLVENDVVGVQKMPDGSTNKEYKHQHMLRGELLSEDGWGEIVQLQGEKKLTRFATIDEKYAIENCQLIAVVLDETTNEVLNVSK